MSRRKLVSSLILSAVLSGTAAIGQQLPSTQPATRPITIADVVDNRPTHVGLRAANTYRPLPRNNADNAAAKVEMIPEALRTSYRIDPFYTKYLTIDGIVVMGSGRVSDYAFLEAAYTLDHQLHDSPQYVLDALKNNKVRLAILACVEYTMDLPENNRNSRNAEITAAAYQDRRSRGLGGMPWCSCAEENLLNLRGDPYGGTGAQGSGENITIHEFSHTLASAIRASQRQGGPATRGVAATRATTGGGGGRGAGGVDGPWWTELHETYVKAMAPGGRLNAWNEAHNGRVYASTDEQEYWAEGAQAWFDNANPGNSGGLSKREDVKEKDPALAKILAATYGDSTWRYIKTTAKLADGTSMRPTAELAHLAGLEAVRGEFPVFSYNNSPRVMADPGRGRGAGGGAGRGNRSRGAAGATTQPGTQQPGRGLP